MLLKRQTFVPSSTNTSILLAIYAQHFTHQFFKTNPKLANEGITESRHYIDLNQVYGSTIDVQHKLREHKGGRMLLHRINGEDLPPFLSEVRVPTLEQVGLWKLDPHKAFALGHPFFAVFPGLAALSTIWLREHNRVAALVQQANPLWGDEQIFQTTRSILTVICMRITVEDYVGANLAKGRFKFKFLPTLMQGDIQYGNRIAVEFNHLYHWHPFLPDAYYIGGENYTHEQLLFDNSVLLKYGVSTVLDAFSCQIAGEANGAM